MKIISVDDAPMLSPIRADDPPKPNADSVDYTVYVDHLARDMANVGLLRNGIARCSCKANPGNCAGAAQHAYDENSSSALAAPPWRGLADYPAPITIYEVEAAPTATPTTNLIGSMTYNRGDVVAYYGTQGGFAHVATCTGQGQQTWEYNGKPNNPANWGLSTVGAETTVPASDGSGQHSVTMIRLYRIPAAP